MKNWKSLLYSEKSGSCMAATGEDLTKKSEENI